MGIGGRPVRRIGLGCMGMSFAYGRDPGSDDPLAVLGAALDRGRPAAAVVLDTADVYGPFANEELVGRALRGRDPASVVVASKAGLVATGDRNGVRSDGRPEHLRAAVDASLRRLGVDRIDLHYLHRVDPAVPIEESWGALAELVAAGKLHALGLSEVGPAELRRAHAVHPVAAVQSELSLFRRVQLAETVPWCERHGATFVAYAPVGRGWLTGSVDAGTTLDADDFRSRLPAFAPDALRDNQALLVHVREIARRRGATPAQVALAWLLHQSPAVVAIPGTRRVARVEENLGALELALDRSELDLLSSTPQPTQPRYARSDR